MVDWRLLYLPLQGGVMSFYSHPQRGYYGGSRDGGISMIRTATMFQFWWKVECES